MNQLVTITSKRQLTIPVAALQKTGFCQGDKIVVHYDKNSITLYKATDLVMKLAGSVPIPSKYKHSSPDELVASAKKRHFSKI